MTDSNYDSACSHGNDVPAVLPTAVAVVGTSYPGSSDSPRSNICNKNCTSGNCDNCNSLTNNSSTNKVGPPNNGAGGSTGSGVRSDWGSRVQVKPLCQQKQATGTSSDDMDVNSNGNSSGNDSNGGESNENESRGRQSTRSSNSSSSRNGKDSAMMLETTESNKSSNSQSPSPPSSSIAYSLLSASSEQDHPSTSGCSSDQSARVKTQKELMKALKELKIRVPAERRSKGKPSTLAALQYALSCVKQVKANQDYYHQWTADENQTCKLDLTSYTVEELENITSKYTLKNTDTFCVVVSLLSGKIVYISHQAAYILRCKEEFLNGAKFAELLAPQDVSVFYSSTAPCHLPSWSACIGTAAPPDCTQEKSMFCRISAGRGGDNEIRYYPFRLTPYLVTLRDLDTADGQSCCLLIAEKIHSGYEAPRIPADKRIFTTSHTPSCLFQDVDERAIPLLGYLPQDLVGTPVLLYLHPEDRPIMVAIHKKILQLAGQPFDHSPIRFCTRNGEYVTIDTSWSSFVNPWSRKVAFIIGRHKVRTSPLNEDVFTTPRAVDIKHLEPDIHELSGQIHRLLVQPVHTNSSLGYCSVGSNGSHEQFLSIASSSDSNGIPAEEARLHKPMTFQQICKDVHMVKNQGQQVFIESRTKPLPKKSSSTGNDAPKQATSKPKQITCVSPASALVETVRKEAPSTYSYQQINCLDSIIRYLESCNVPNTVKRKCGSSSCTASSNSDDDKQKMGEDGPNINKGSVVELGTPGGNKESKGTAHPLTPLALPSKAESVVSITSQCSFSSTIVHVGDKKPPESDIVMMEEAPATPVQPQPAAPASATSQPLDKDSKDPYRKVGLTKEVLSIHTQKEEQAFLSRFKDLSRLRVFESPCEQQQVGRSKTGVRNSRHYPAAGSSSRRGRGGKSKAKRLKHHESSEHAMCSGGGSGNRGQSASSPNLPQCSTFHSALPGPSSVSWPPSVTSQASLPPLPFPGVLPTYSIPMFAQRDSLPSAPQLAQGTFTETQSGTCFPMQPVPSQYPSPIVTPMVTFVLPNYMFPQLNGTLPQPYFPNQMFSFTSAGTSTSNMPSAPTTTMIQPNTQELSSTSVAPPLPLQETAKPYSCCSTPPSSSQPPNDREEAESPLFESRCSSPLQLNLLQLEETTAGNRLEMTSSGTGVQGQVSGSGSGSGNANTVPEWPGAQAGGVSGKACPRNDGNNQKENENHGEANESFNQDAMSSSSDLLDLLLQEDSRSGTGSAASGSGSAVSGSMGSGSNGCSTSACGTRSSQSSHTSKYFGSIDSSENDNNNKKCVSGLATESDQFIRYVLQDPIWLLMANTDEKVMMTYQLPVRDKETILREDREKLKAMQKHQPRLTEEQKKELCEVHPWVKTGRLPKAVNISACVGCGISSSVAVATPFDVELHEMDLSGMLDSGEEGCHKGNVPAETAMEEEEEELEDQEMPSAEQEMESTSQQRHE
ncbi:period circadian protein homolog 1b isoform X1 [Polypterus senegalus]|uniref:period circadian protein homolog 1b isoform X1 n=2 Tax=Polypterus senegalus TaxID=55291 RepID=UPI001963EF96|nr:period circadian protein homolog 1b isoform X1 [Polypterus senegalus]XP_039603049.1 period circadian protein homolog 1b isoform X1 [Polypterus senegalus]